MHGEVHSRCLLNTRMHPRSNFRLDILIFKSFDYLQKTRWQSFDKIFVMPYLPRMYEMVLHELPARLTDLAVTCVGQKPFALRLCHKMQRGMRSLEYFTTHQVDRYLDVLVVIQWCIYCQGSQFLQNVQFCYPELCLGILLFKRKFALNYSFIKLCAE